MFDILSNVGVSIEEFKENFSKVLEEAEGFPVVIINNNQPEAYLVPAEYFETLLESLEDYKLASIARERLNTPLKDTVEVDLNEL